MPFSAAGVPAVLKSELVGLKVMEMYGVAEVDVVLGGGEGIGDVVVSQFNTLDDFYIRLVIYEREIYWFKRHFFLCVTVEVHRVCMSSMLKHVTHSIVGEDERDSHECKDRQEN